MLHNIKIVQPMSCLKELKEQGVMDAGLNDFS
jgi:hypothetical protein